MALTPAERQARIAELKIEFDELDQDKYNSRDLARQRGLDFEGLIREVFKAWDMLRRGPYHTGDNSSEQIDGVLQIAHQYALLEVKWVKANLAASELFAFLGKVEGKFVGTIGIFVSRNELTTNFITALRAGRRQSIVVIHGQDVDRLFDNEFDLSGYLKRHLLHICMDNTCYLSSEDYLTWLKKEAAENVAPVAGDVVQDRIDECLAVETSDNLVDEFAHNFDQNQQVDATRRILEIYPEVASSREPEGVWRRRNLRLFIKELVVRLPAVLTVADTEYFLERLSKDFKNHYYGPLIEDFGPRYPLLPAGTKTTIEGRLTKQWNKIIDDWVLENYMAVPTAKLWPYLAADTKSQLIPHFVDFVLSSRQLNREQHTLAREVLALPESNANATEAIKKHAKDAAKNWFQYEPVNEQNIQEGTTSVKRSLKAMRPYVPTFDAVIEETVAEVAAEAQ